jgi:hypothetical protein
MKTKLIIPLLLLALTIQVYAQDRSSNTLQKAIVGTWQLTSAEIDAGGQPVNLDMTKVNQYKIITPTHWMYVLYNPDDTLRKVDGNGGTYTLSGNKYIETLTYAKSDFTVRVDGDTYYQEGTLTLPDGQKMQLNERYERVKEPNNQDAKIVGAWERISSYYMKDGKKVTDPENELMLITPSHYMWVTKKEGKSTDAMVGTYKMEGNKIIPNPILANAPIVKDDKIEIAITHRGDQMTTIGTVTNNGEKKLEWTTVFKKVNAKPKIATKAQ